jgi:hypothetical protein
MNPTAAIMYSTLSDHGVRDYIARRLSWQLGPPSSLPYWLRYEQQRRFKRRR